MYSNRLTVPTAAAAAVHRPDQGELLFPSVHNVCMSKTGGGCTFFAAGRAKRLDLTEKRTKNRRALETGGSVGHLRYLSFKQNVKIFRVNEFEHIIIIISFPIPFTTANYDCCLICFCCNDNFAN